MIIRRLFPLLSLFSLAATLRSAESNGGQTVLAEVAAAKDVPALAALLQAQIHALPDLVLQVSDADSLVRVAAPVKSRVATIDAIAARLKKLPVPPAAERAEISARMQAQDAAHAKTKHAAMMQHLEKLKPDLRAGVRAEMGKFFAALDANKEVLKKYFAPDEPESPARPQPDKARPETKHRKSGGPAK